MKLSEQIDKKIRKELVFLSKFVDIYCSHKHEDRSKKGFSFSRLDDKLWNGIRLCGDCAKLLSHGIIMRIKCPMDPRVRTMSPDENENFGDGLPGREPRQRVAWSAERSDNADGYHQTRLTARTYLSDGLSKKPMCKKCPDKCYNAYYEKQIVDVMKFSGMKMILGGRVDLVYHYFF